MRLGLIARTDDSGLGTQTLEAYRHLKPHKVLAIDYASFNGFKQHPEWYPGAQFVTSIPSPTEVKRFLDDLDVVFSCETPYSYHLLELARFLGIKTVIQPNYELFPYIKNKTYPKPDLWAFPSQWHLNDVPFPNKMFLPVPIATDRFEGMQDKPAKAINFLHIVGKPAANNRNGTDLLIDALPHIKSVINLTIKCQSKPHLTAFMHQANPPSNVKVIFDFNYQPEYWQNYKDQHVLIMPRRYGGLCLPVNEALGAGMPVIMPDCEPNNLWLPKGWLVPVKSTSSFEANNTVEMNDVDPVELAKKIDDFANNNNDLWKLSVSQAALLAADNSWEKLLPMYVDTFNSLLQ